MLARFLATVPKVMGCFACLGIAIVALLYGDQYPVLLEKVVVATGFVGPARLIASKYDGPFYCTCRTSDDYARFALEQLAVERPDVVATLMRDPNLTVAYSAISVSGRSRVSAYVPELIRHTSSLDPYERTIALYSLASIGDVRAKPILERAYKKGENDEVSAVGGAGLVIIGEKGNGHPLSDLSDRALNSLAISGPRMVSSEYAASNLAMIASLASDDPTCRQELLDRLNRDTMLSRLRRCISGSNAVRRQARTRTKST